MLTDALDEGEASKFQFRSERVLTDSIRRFAVGLTQGVACGDECAGFDMVEFVQRSKPWAGDANPQCEQCIAVHAVVCLPICLDDARVNDSV